MEYESNAACVEPPPELDDLDGLDIGVEPIGPDDMPKKIEDYIELTTPELAAEHLKHNGYEKQRGLMQRRFRELCRKNRDGRFHGSDIAKARLVGFDYLGNDGKNYRELMMNGQHTCKMIVDTGIPAASRIKVFECHSQRQLATLYGQFDPPGGQRTQRQIAHSYTDVLVGWNKDEIVLVCGGVSLATRKFAKCKRSELSIDERINLLFDPEIRPHADFVRNTISTDGGKNVYPHMNRQGVAAAIYVTHDVAPDRAFDFWDRVKKGHDLAVDSPGLVLRNFLMNSITVGGQSGKTAKLKNVVTPEEMIKRCLQAWNAAVQGNTYKKGRFGAPPASFPKPLPWE